jgi:copper chaperone CopZ
MSCNNCVRHVDQALRAVPGVTAVEVSLPEQRAKVEHTGEVALPALIAAVESAGYEAVTAPA